MIQHFTTQELDFFKSKVMVYVGIAQEFRNKKWEIHGWEYFKVRKVSRSKIVLVLEDDDNEELIITKKDLIDGFVKVC